MNQNNHPNTFEREFSLKQTLNDRFDDIRYLWQFKKLLITCIALGAIAGALAAYFKKPTYTARLTFVVDDTKSSSSLGGLSSLAGQFGLNLDALSGGSGILQGDNIKELVKSQNLIKNTLVSSYDSVKTLADQYAAVYKLNKKWSKFTENGEVVKFPLNAKNNTRLQDSLLHEMIELILEKGQFDIRKPDKKLDFFEIQVEFRDEKLSKLFCQRIINQSTNFYIKTKTKRLKTNVDRLQIRADSIERLLNNKVYSLSATERNSLDLNPAFNDAEAKVEVKKRDKTLLSSVYTETVKNLEASKTMLAQETPTVQIVDEPELPLKKNNLKYWIAITVGVFIMVVLFVLYKLLTKKTNTQPTAIS